MAEQAYSIVGAFQACGIDAALTYPSNQETVYWGRKYTSGKECYPCILTTGDMVKVIKSPDSYELVHQDAKMGLKIMENLAQIVANRLKTFVDVY